MKSFSQRKGLKPVKSVMQVDSMDEDLRNGLWNALTFHYWLEIGKPTDDFLITTDKNMYELITSLWLNYFKNTYDAMDIWWRTVYKILREYYFECEWHEVYDFIEFVANNYPDEDKKVNQKFMDFCNTILERELSAYRFVGGVITQITSEEEIEEIEKALEVPLKPVNTHLKTALDLLANKKSPDYRNSVKESISAVESICKLITGDDKTTLGDALKIIEKDSKVELHQSLKKAFSSLYGYTNDADGIRHALFEESNLDFEDAKFMLVSCSAFVNYLVAKSSKAGIKL